MPSTKRLGARLLLSALFLSVVLGTPLGGAFMPHRTRGGIYTRRRVRGHNDHGAVPAPMWCRKGQGGDERTLNHCVCGPVYAPTLPGDEPRPALNVETGQRRIAGAPESSPPCATKLSGPTISDAHHATVGLDVCLASVPVLDGPGSDTLFDFPRFVYPSYIFMFLTFLFAGRFRFELIRKHI